MAVRIAIVEDDPEMGEYFKTLLSHNGYQSSLYPTAGRFFDSIPTQHPIAVILDMQLPGMDGREIIRVLRSNPETRGLFVIAVSGKYNKTSDVITGLQAGADEYMSKPVNADLLMARIQTLMRRGESVQTLHQEALRAGPLLVLPEERSVRLNDKEISLTRLEFDLLTYLLKNANRVLTRSIILEAVWKGDPTMNTRTVDKHVESLRHKLGGAVRIETMVRVGYMLKS